MSGGALAGALFDSALAGAALALGYCLALQLRYLIVLRRWAQHPKRIELPEPPGLWGETYELLLDRYERSRQRKRQLTTIVSQFQASTEALPDGAVVLSERGEIKWFNAAAQALLGLRSSDDLGLRVANLIRHPAFTDYVTQAHDRGEVEVPSPINAAVTLSLRIIPYGDSQRLLIARDVSDRKRLETARRDFVANASHELRTPLTVLRGYLEMMEQEARPQGALAEWHAPLAEMKAQAARMQALLDDLLRLARLEAEVITTREGVLDLPGLLQSALDDARALSQGRHEVEAEVEPGLLLVGREGELRSVLGNLVANAVQYTPPGGTIVLRWWSDERGAHLSVSDTGIGVSAEDLPRLTERFYRVDVGRSRASGGTGLGLSIVKHALELHEGRLEVQSRLGAGSTFICHFPGHRVRRQTARAATR